MRGFTITTQSSACANAELSNCQSHFTGKERDTESGNDYFGARYYGSSMGRFMSPDYSDDPVPVPYASLGDPQSLNLYAYAGNNPMTFSDEDGHSKDCGGGGDKSVVCLVTTFWDWLTVGGGLIPVFRTEPSTIFVFRKVWSDVEEQAHRSADDFGGQADGGGPQG